MKISREAINKARKENIIPAAPVRGGGNFGSDDPNYKLLSLGKLKGQTLIAYIPNMVREPMEGDQEGEKVINADFYSVHNMVDPKGRNKYGIDRRCIRGIHMDEYGLDGTCPMDDLASGIFSDASEWLEKDATWNGFADKESKDAKTYKSSFYDRYMKVGFARDRVTIPIAVLETTVKSKGPVKEFVPVVEENEAGKSVPVINYYYWDASMNQYESLISAYQGGFTEEDEELIEKNPDKQWLPDSWVKITIPDAERASDAVRDMTISRYAKYDRGANKTGNSISALINKVMTEKMDFTPEHAMEILHKNQLHSVPEYEELIAGFRTAHEDLRAATQKGGSLESAKDSSTESSLDALIEESDDEPKGIAEKPKAKAKAEPKAEVADIDSDDDGGLFDGDDSAELFEDE